MIQLFEHFRNTSSSRSGFAAMLAIWLNLALLPCAMAFQALDEAHDCCPQSIEMQQLECCGIDDVTVDRRDGGDGYDIVATSLESRVPLPTARSIVRLVAPPPNPDSTSPPLHVLNCVYLK